jgi:GT2 family glycosyltransferase
VSALFFNRKSYPEEAAALELLALPEDALAVGIDLSAPADALARLIDARRAGKATAVLALLVDPLEPVIAAILQHIAAIADPEERRSAYEGLRANTLVVNGKKPSELALYTKEHVNAAALALRLADIVLVETTGERDRWARLLQRPLRRYAVLPTPPAETSPSGDWSTITIYAPSTPRALLVAYEQLVREKNLDTAVVSLENADTKPATRIVIAPEWRALRARALAQAGHHVVAPDTLHVDDCDARIFAYSPISVRSLLAALDGARSAATNGRARTSPSPQAVSETIAAERARVLEGPLVSIVIRTFDRPALLERAITSVASQSYRNVEIVVANNGGPNVEPIVERASRGRPYRYVGMAERKHISAASNAGARAASGFYVGYLDDDDLLYADHAARAVDVLERTQSDLAFTLCVGEYAEMNGATKKLLGYQIYMDREYDPDRLYVVNLTPIHTVVHRRDLFDRFGYFDETLPVTDDWELWLRAASLGARFVRIDRATCEYSWRYDQQRGNMTIEHQNDFVRAYREITARYGAKVADRRGILAEQAATLSVQEKRAAQSADPSKRASVVISSMSAELVPVTATSELMGTAQP